MDKSWFRGMFVGRRVPQQPPAPTMPDEADAETQFHLGVLLSNSAGDAQNCVQAAHWYRKAANLNHPLAQFNLGLMYANGQGVAVDDHQALTWIRKAAEQGDAGAQFNLGDRYHRSSMKQNALQADASESKIEAYKWLQLAAAQGYNHAHGPFQRLTLAMTFDEVADGNRRAAAFSPATPASPQRQ
jgi:TPR repeat protein